MPSTLEFCDQFYGTRDVYAIFAVSKDAQASEIKKAYYKLSLKVHPDRVHAAEKEESTEKFKILSKIYTVLSDKDKRALYDEQGIIDDDEEGSVTNWLKMWQQFFKPITAEDINNYEKTYVGSEIERDDIKKAYLNGKGCINYMMDYVQFMKCGDEPRISEIVQQMIAAGEVPEYKIFTNEPEEKRIRRHKRYAREAKEVAELKKAQKQSTASLEQQLARRQSERAQAFAALFDKYSSVEDNSEAFEIDELVAGSSKKSKKETKPKKDKTRGKVSKGKTPK